jgi:hypothetical protein
VIRKTEIGTNKEMRRRGKHLAETKFQRIHGWSGKSRDGGREDNNVRLT